jgi:hypothetical protein
MLVETRAHGEGWIEIEGSLRPNDLVVVRGHTRLDEGVVVSIRHADGTPVAEPAAEATASEAAPVDVSNGNAS